LGFDSPIAADSKPNTETLKLSDRPTAPLTDSVKDWADPPECTKCSVPRNSGEATKPIEFRKTWLAGNATKRRNRPENTSNREFQRVGESRNSDSPTKVADLRGPSENSNERETFLGDWGMTIEFTRFADRSNDIET
jgi:hypothetical protein